MILAIYPVNDLERPMTITDGSNMWHAVTKGVHEPGHWIAGVAFKGSWKRLDCKNSAPVPLKSGGVVKFVIYEKEESGNFPETVVDVYRTLTDPAAFPYQGYKVAGLAKQGIRGMGYNTTLIAEVLRVGVQSPAKSLYVCYPFQCKS